MAFKKLASMDLGGGRTLVVSAQTDGRISIAQSMRVIGGPDMYLKNALVVDAPTLERVAALLGEVVNKLTAPSVPASDQPKKEASG